MATGKKNDYAKGYAKRAGQTAAEKKAYKKRNFGVEGKLGGMGGQYGRKSENLTAQQLKRAGAGGAAKKRTVSISQTSRATEGVNKGRTLGPGGKPLTGSVTLENGNTAVYKDGKRVIATPAAAKKAAPARSATPAASASASRPATTNRPAKKAAPARKPDMTQAQKNNSKVDIGDVKRGPNGVDNRWNGKRWVRVIKADSSYLTGNKVVSKGQPKRTQGPTIAEGFAASFKARQPTMTSTKKPTEGAYRIAIVNGEKQNQTYRGGKWVKR